MPTRWYAGGKGLDDFRDEMLDDIHIETLYDCVSPEDIFPNTNIRGGVCYFLWNAKYDNHSAFTKVYTRESGKETVLSTRPLKVDGLDIFIRYNAALTILKKVKAITENYMDPCISPRRPFGIDANIVKSAQFSETKKKETDLKCLGKGQTYGFIAGDKVTQHREWISPMKLFTPRANNIGTELNDDNLNTFIGEPNTICTESYIIIGAELNLNTETATSLSKYLTTKFARFMHSLAKASQDATSKTYRFVPLQDFSAHSDIDWSKSVRAIDRRLYAKYGLSDDEINFIEDKIKPME